MMIQMHRLQKIPFLKRHFPKKWMLGIFNRSFTLFREFVDSGNKILFGLLKITFMVSDECWCSRTVLFKFSRLQHLTFNHFSEQLHEEICLEVQIAKRYIHR